MNCLHERHVWVAVAALSLVVACRDLKAQTTRRRPQRQRRPAPEWAWHGIGTGMGTGMGMGMGMGGGMGLMPMLYAMNPTASLSPTDAAALGMSRLRITAEWA